MEQYCSALLNQEKSLEDLQRHLRTTEELFRESVKRKNQQLDLLQSEVRRLKTSVGVRDEGKVKPAQPEVASDAFASHAAKHAAGRGSTSAQRAAVGEPDLPTPRRGRERRGARASPRARWSARRNRGSRREVRETNARRACPVVAGAHRR